MNTEAWIRIGSVGRPWGLQGYFHVSGRDVHVPKQYGKVVIGDSPEAGETFEIYSSKLQSGRPVLKLKSINKREHLETWFGKSLWVQRSAIRIQEEKEYLWPDLVGKKLLDSHGVEVGIIREVSNHGASDIITVTDDESRSLDIPLIKSFVDLTFRSEDTAIRLLVSKGTFDDLWANTKKSPTS